MKILFYLLYIIVGGLALVGIASVIQTYMYTASAPLPVEEVIEVPEVVEETEDSPIAEEAAFIDDLITVESPLPGSTVSNPLQVSGRARGYWFFEASAPVVVTNWDGLIIGEGFVTTQGDWMTEDFVPFSGTISYDLPVDSYSATGTLIFKKDNPSGLPENDQALEFTVMLQ